jgi:hypothetical protein
MKYILIVLALFATASLFWFCKHTRYTAQNFPARQLRWGKGGGITGMEVMYAMAENGQVIKSEGRALPVLLDDVKRKKARGIFEAVQMLELQKIDFKHPGNTYSFIEMTDSTGNHRVSWGAADFPVDSKIQDIYQQLNSLIGPDKK